MASTQQKCKSLQEKLNLLPQVRPDNPKKQKINNVEQFLRRTYQQFAEDSFTDQYKFKKMRQQCRSIQLILLQHSQALANKQKSNILKLDRYDKKSQKIIEKISKSRRDTQKSINSTLQNYLIQLSSAKAKNNSSCKFALKDFNDLEQELQAMQIAIDNQEVANKEITKKIYAQFSVQIDELNQLIIEQRKQRQNDQNRIFSRLQSMYKKMHGLIEIQKKNRQTKQQQAIQFLERVIEKVREQIVKK